MQLMNTATIAEVTLGWRVVEIFRGRYSGGANDEGGGALFVGSVKLGRPLLSPSDPMLLRRPCSNWGGLDGLASFVWTNCCWKASHSVGCSGRSLFNHVSALSPPFFLLLASDFQGTSSVVKHCPID